MTSLPTTSQQINLRLDTLSIKAQWRVYLGVLLLHDTAITALALALAYYVRFNSGLTIFQTTAPPFEGLYGWVTLLLVALLLGLYAAHGLYNPANLLGGTQEYARVFRACTTAVVAILALQTIVRAMPLARAWQLLVWLLTFLLVSAGRFWLRRAVYALRLRGWFLTPALLIGANEEGHSLAEQLGEWQTSGLHLVGFVDEHAPIGTHVRRDLRTLGRCADLDELIRRHNIGNLIVATSALQRPMIVDLFRQYGMRSDLNFHLSSGLFETITTNVSVQEFVAAPLVRINRVQLTGVDALLKRALDVVLSATLLLLAAPLLLLLVLLVRRDSPGPAIYRRGVLGLNGRRFDAFKFRTMAVNGDEILAHYPDLQAELAAEHKLRHDPRVTRLGRLLRRSSLDELPQLFNVLKGDMSLVGPRMITPAEVAKYGQWGLNLLTVRPGLTGLWQISGRSDTGYAERVQFDMRYIRNWSIWLDLYILLRTIPAVLKSEGAY